MVGLSSQRCVKICHGIIVGQTIVGLASLRFTKTNHGKPLEATGTQKLAHASLCNNVK